MPGPTVVIELVEPQSLKKLGLKSIKCSLDLFSPFHAQFHPPDPESKKIRMSHKINVGYGGIKGTVGRPTRQANSGATYGSNQVCAPSNALPLPGPEGSTDPQKEQDQNALVLGPSLQPKGLTEVGNTSKSTSIVSAPGFSERLTTSAIIERVPSKWPGPVWHPPWKNYRSVRAMAKHPKEHCFASASSDNIKKFSLPKGEFLHNMLLWLRDWKSGHNFQQAQTIVQPGSLDSEASIYALSYDMTGTRLVTWEADKTIKMWKEDESATPETHPLNFRPPKDIRRF